MKVFDLIHGHIYHHATTDYLHHHNAQLCLLSQSCALGKLAVLVAYEGENGDLARQVAMHIAASNPIAVSKDDLDPSLIEREKNIFAQQAKDSGKSENIIENMVNGRMKKYFDEVTLLSQKFVIDPEVSVKDAIEKENLKILGFKRISVGEGIEKEEENFADEVAKTIGNGFD